MPTAQSEGVVCEHPETQRLVLPCNVWGTYRPEVYPRQEVRPQTYISYTRGASGGVSTGVPALLPRKLNLPKLEGPSGLRLSASYRQSA